MGSLDWTHNQNLGAIGSTGTTAANRAAAEADVVIGIGTRYSDFTTASRTAFQNPNVKFVNINVASFDAAKHGSSIPVVADAHHALTALSDVLTGFCVEEDYRTSYSANKAQWDAAVDESFADKGLVEPGQAEIIGAVWEASAPEDTVVCAAGSLPGDLHKLWRVRDGLGYHVEYGYSCMGYEIAGGLGVARAKEKGDSIVMVGDGSYLMMHTEIVTAVAEGLKFIIVLIQNHGYASIGHLSEDLGSQRYGTLYRFHDEAGNNFETGERLPIDLAANAESLGIDVIRVEKTENAISDLKEAVKRARESDRSTVIHIHSDPLLYAPDGEGWWDVPVAEVSTLESTQKARAEYDRKVATQKHLLGRGVSERKSK
jgi:3D-(3,5/4)-trihydroxycyclohexane-1,2-dione acylhydrolase (decyclizing)